MKLFFLCRTGHHTSMLAAGLYLGLLKHKDEVSDFVGGFRGYGNIRNQEIGTPYYLGNTDHVEVYTIGVAKESGLIERAVNELINIIGPEHKQKRVINVSSAVSPWTRIGFLLMRLHLLSPTNWFVRVGARAELDKVAKLLKKSELNEMLE